MTATGYSPWDGFDVYAVTMPSGTTFRVYVSGRHVVRADPPGDWLAGKTFVSLRQWLRQKRGTITGPIPPRPDSEDAC